MESLFQNCFFVDNPRFRHDLGVSYQHLCEHLVNTVLVTLRNVKKSLAKQRVAPQGGVEVKNISSVQELMRFEAFFQPEDREGVQCIEHIEKGLLRCNSALVASIRAGLPTHSLLMISELLSITSRHFGTNVTVFVSANA